MLLRPVARKEEKQDVFASVHSICDSLQGLSNAGDRRHGLRCRGIAAVDEHQGSALGAKQTIELPPYELHLSPEYLLRTIPGHREQIQIDLFRVRRGD